MASVLHIVWNAHKNVLLKQLLSGITSVSL